MSLSGYEYRALLDTPGLTAQLDDRGHRAPLDIQGRGQHMELLPGRRQPGAGYEALHPELEGLNPEDCPDIHKMAILADVAPYSREYNTYRLRVAKEVKGNTELQIEYEKILDRVRRTRVFRPVP